MKYTIKCYIEDLAGFDKWIEALSDETLRRDIIESGYKQADDFLASFFLSTDESRPNSDQPNIDSL